MNKTKMLSQIVQRYRLLQQVAKTKKVPVARCPVVCAATIAASSSHYFSSSSSSAASSHTTTTHTHLRNVRNTTAHSLQSSSSSSSSSSFDRKSQQIAWKSSLAPQDDESEEVKQEIHHNHNHHHDKKEAQQVPAPSEAAAAATAAASHTDSTYSKGKFGTPSPWAVFDAWGAGCDEVASKTTQISKERELLLSDDNVRIPLNSTEAASVPSETNILAAYDEYLTGKSTVHFGYPYNLMYDHTELHPFMKYSINNLGDPFVPSNYAVHSRQFECSVIDFFAQLWNMEPDSYWGYVTTCGTEGNLHAILLARECHPTGILYTSQETHYSIFKAARYYRMECNSIPTLPMGEINYDLLAESIAENRHKPVIINVNIGTTVKGAVDNLDRIIDILRTLEIPRENYHIHCDGALFALMLPFIENCGHDINFQTKPIDSIAVSGHKMLGCPMPCGIALTKKKHVQKVEQHIDYLNSVDTTIMGSRNGQAALYLWYSLRKKGIAGIKRDVAHCMDTAKFLLHRLTEIGISCRLNDLSSTVVLERPLDDTLIKRWQLACEEDIAHVVVMPNVTEHKINQFVSELEHCIATHGRIQPARPQSPLMQLASKAWDKPGESDSSEGASTSFQTAPPPK